MRGENEDNDDVGELNLDVDEIKTKKGKINFV